MKTLEDFKNEVAEDNGFVSWDNLTFIHAGFIKVVQPFNDEATRRFAIEVAKEALKIASENAYILTTRGAGYSYNKVSKKSILDENNIPKI